MSSSFVDAAVTVLYQYGAPPVVLGVVASIIRSHIKRRDLVRNAPEQKIDDSLQRMQQTAIIQDNLVESLQNALDASTLRERELQSRLGEIERQLDLTKTMLTRATEQLEALQRQFPPSSSPLRSPGA